MSLIERVRSEFTIFASDAAYPCLGARSAIRRQGCAIGVYGPMSDVTTTRALAGDLVRFTQGEASAAHFVAYVAMFLEAAPSSEGEFETRLWRQLSALAAVDERSWAPDVSADPRDANFAFSFNETPFFVIGLHPASSRRARQSTWPALVFNPHAQFRRLRAEGRFERMRTEIRSRDRALQGNVNPNLADAGETSEARQYSGRQTDDAWRCPFHHPNT